jgi:hypothetical protein
MKRQISKDECVFLHQFCKRHFVHYYDVRLELVDHLASSIEAIWEQDDSVDFYKALDRIYKDFGPTGFRKLVAAKEAIVEKDFNRGMLKGLGNVLNSPNLNVLIGFIAISFFAYSYLTAFNPELIGWYIAVIAILSFFHSIVVIVRINRWRKSSTESLLATHFSSSLFIGYFSEFALINYGTNKLIYPGEQIYFSLEHYLLMCGLALITLWCNLALMKQARHNLNRAKERYPEQFAG